MFQAAVAQLGRLARDVALVDAEHERRLALAEAVAQPEAEDQRLAVGQVGQPFAGRLAELLVPAVVAVGRERQVAVVEVVVRQGVAAAVMAEVGEVFILKHADEPGHERPLAVVAGENGRGAVAFAGQEKAPELGDGFLLLLRVAREQPHGPRAQGVDEQRVGAVGAGVEQGAPAFLQPLQAGAGGEPVEGVQVLDEIVPRRLAALADALGPVQIEGAGA